MIEFGSVFYEVAALLVLAALCGLGGILLRQPLIVSFIITGVLAGPSVLGVVRSTEHLHLLAEIGVSLLLFLVGLKLDLSLIRTLGPVAVATGLGQVLFTSIVGFFICLGLGLDTVASLYIAVALTFSSTIIIVKLLSDKREIDSLHGRIALGFLIVQDIAVVVAMVGLSGFGIGKGQGPLGTGVAGVVAGGVVLLGLIALFMRFAAERLARWLAESPELLLTFSIAWAVALASIGDWLGFGKELGGLLAGVSLASTTYRDAIASRLASLRDFLLLFFFIGLGSRLDLGMLGGQTPAAIVLSLFVLIGNPLIVVAIMGYMGYRKRTGFLAGLTVAQISEFSLIFMALALALGHVRAEAMSIVTIVGLVTITLSTYMIYYSHPLYRLCEPLLGIFERRTTHREDAARAEAQDGGALDVILLGLGRYGREIGEKLLAEGKAVLAVDFDPFAVSRWRERGRPVLYGDASDPEFVASLPLRRAAWIIVAVPPHDTGITHSDLRHIVLHAARAAGFAGKIAVIGRDGREREELEKAGAERVLLPYSEAAERLIELIAGPADGRSAGSAAADIQGGKGNA
jgi:Kef-type K+ transport system membrane component KefB/voltage-gated potassium channel Kch